MKIVNVLANVAAVTMLVPVTLIASPVFFAMDMFDQICGVELEY